MAHLPPNRPRRRILAEFAAGLIFVAIYLYVFPSLRQTFYTAEGWRLLRDGELNWARDVIHNPAISAVVLAAASAVMYFGIRLIRR
jgi:hypothetical protein